MRFILILLFFTLATIVSGQDSRLASQYYNSGEYEKAAALYQKLFEKTPNNYYLFSQFIESLLALEEYSLAEGAIKKQIKKQPDHMQLYVTYGHLLERQYMPEKAEEKYRQAIENMPNKVSIINNLGNSFSRLRKNELAIETYKKAEQILDNKKLFAYNLGELYRKTNNTTEMIRYYIVAASQNKQQVESYKSRFQRNLKTDDQLEELRKQLYQKIQDEPENEIFPELLEWVFIEKEDYNGALRQARALDRKYEESGNRVIKIANIAKNSGEYDTAIKAYEYIIDKKGTNSSYYSEAQGALLKTKLKKITSDYNHTMADLDSLDAEYSKFINEVGINSQSEFIIKEYADFLAIYKNDLPKAISTLTELVELGSINKYVKANAKISLADYYLMEGEIWESTLLYSQVEKQFKEEYLGEVSRFKNAKLAYYAGEFAWAQEQFDILKTATTRLISNDAIDLSVFIMDNMGLDTTDVPLKMFSEAELLTVQNRTDEAFAKLDSINMIFPKHALEDDILFQKANLYVQLKDYEKAKELYTKVYTEFAEEIRADNALYSLANLYNNQLENPEKAMELFEKLFIDFSNSTFAIESRKKFRILRGDDIQ